MAVEALRRTAKQHYSVPEIYRIAAQGGRGVGDLRRLRARRGPVFVERIMLAVTEVNGCALCSYGHARFALDAGMSPGEVRALLGGVADGVPDDELPAIGFAQHYAASRGHPDEEAWSDLVAAYGRQEARGILGAVRVMMWGNAVGIPPSSLLGRLRGRPDPGSSLGYELGTILGSALVTPVACLRGVVADVRREPIITFGRRGAGEGNRTPTVSLGS